MIHGKGQKVMYWGSLLLVPSRSPPPGRRWIQRRQKGFQSSLQKAEDSRVRAVASEKDVQEDFMLLTQLQE
jgi:hypothetical protein